MKFIFSFCLTLILSTSAYADRPNIVVMLCDDLGYGDLECYGHPRIKTPNLNRLAEGGVRLTSCYSAAPVCSPSRVGLLTGRSPNRAGVYDWIPPGNNQKSDLRDMVHMRDSEVTIAKLLKDAGYATCMSGKWHCNSKFNSKAQPQPGDAGFEHWFGTQNNAAPSHENPHNFVRNGEPAGQLNGFSCQLVATEAIQWITKQHEQDADKPFFLYLAFHEPHEPVASPKELVDVYRAAAKNEDEAHYFANVANVDKAVGRVVETLKNIGEFENTLIVFTSDNGPETLKRYARAKRSYGTPGNLRGMKLWTTDAGFRVAGIMHWTAMLKDRKPEDSQVVSSLDFLPTFCELAESQIPDTLALDGTSLVPWLRGEKLQRTKPLVWCYFNALNERRVAMRWKEWKMLARLNKATFPKRQNLSVEDRESILNIELADFQLFRVVDDIDESQDLMQVEAETAERMKALMKQEFQELVENSHYWQR